jgi:hypothetical protein
VLLGLPILVAIGVALIFAVQKFQLYAVAFVDVLLIVIGVFIHTVSSVVKDACEKPAQTVNKNSIKINEIFFIVISCTYKTIKVKKTLPQQLKNK